jgi:hypothetical protein
MEGDDAMKGQEHPTPRDIPIGIGATGQRHETDSMGGIDVPANRYWGAQTQRSLVHFAIGDDRMPKRVYHVYGYVKKAAALACRRARRPGGTGGAGRRTDHHAVARCRPTCYRDVLRPIPLARGAHFRRKAAFGHALRLWRAHRGATNLKKPAKTQAHAALLKAAE